MVMGDNSVQTDIRAESSQTSDSTKRRLLRSLPTRTRLTYTSGWGRYCVCTSIIKRAWGACSRMRFSAWAATIKWFRERWQALKNWYGSRWVVVWFQKNFSRMGVWRSMGHHSRNWCAKQQCDIPHRGNDEEQAASQRLRDLARGRLQQS